MKVSCDITHRCKEDVLQQLFSANAVVWYLLNKAFLHPADIYK